MKQDVIYIVVAILTPLLPAYLIYRNLPSRTDVQGPFHGLQIKLGGAFGGYFLLVLCIFGYIALQQRAFTVYTVEGKIQLKPGQASEAVSMYLSPPTSQVLDSGDFTMKIALEKGRPEIPRLLIECPGYDTICINLAEDKAGASRLHWDESKIKIQTPIELIQAEAAPYQPEVTGRTAIQD